MGYGGFFKTVVRVVVPLAVALTPIGSPLVVAISAAAATGATGGSFKEALISGATSYVGSRIGQAIGDSLGNAADIANQAAYAVSDPGVAAVLAPVAGGAELGSAVSGSEIVDELLSHVPGVGKLSQDLGGLGIAGGVSRFNAAQPWTSVDGIVSNLTSFDVYKELGQKTLNELGAKTIADVSGKAIGALSGMTLEQALLAGTPEAMEAIRSTGLTDSAIAALTQEARNSLAQKKFDDLILNTPNPFRDDAEFRKVVAAGIERRNTGLGKTVTQPQWDAAFSGNDLGAQLLGEEQSLRRDVFEQSAKKDFPAFQPINNTKLINQLVGEQEGPAFNTIARAEARGSLNPYGGKTAKEAITSQRETATKRVGDLSQSLVSSGQRDIGDIQSKAVSAARSYKLGDELFDPAPYRQQAEQAVAERQGSFERDLRDLLGPEQLFDPLGAVTSAGRAQGQVSGASPALLDAIANRVGTRNRERGLGNRGSGVF